MHDRLLQIANIWVSWSVLYWLDEIGKEEVIIHGQNYEQAEIRAKEGPGDERFGDGQPDDDQPDGKTLGESIILPKVSTN